MKFAALFIVILSASISMAQTTDVSSQKQVTLGHRSAPILTIDGLQFKDLNRNGKLDPYE